ncbi:MAG: MFS transporter [Candidatus Accumulibacter sp.]|jgi:predicted MFS family arabinose efflux permease|nr:MFS transporter [Accumulibacter sp.]
MNPDNPPLAQPVIAPIENRRQASRFIIWLTGFFGFLNIYSAQSILPLIIETFHATPVQAGITVGATILAIAILSPFIGMLSDAIGRKSLLCVSFFALALPTALIPAVSGLQMVIALRFLQGLFVPGIIVVILAYIAEEFDKDMVPRMSSIYMGGSVMGGFSGRFITGHLSHLVGWQNAFFTLAASILGGALLMLFFLPPSRNFKPNRNFVGALKTFAGHMRNARLIAACAVGFCVLFSLVGVFTYVNLLLVKPPYELSVAAIANIFCVYLVGVIITPISGRFIARFGFRRVLLCALFTSMSGAFLTLTSPLLLIIGGLVICSSGVFVCQSTTISFIADSVSEGRSLASGLYFMSYYGGGAAGSWLAGIAYENLGGWPGSVATVIAIQCIAAAIAWFTWKKPGGEKTETGKVAGET